MSHEARTVLVRDVETQTLRAKGEIPRIIDVGGDGGGGTSGQQKIQFQYEDTNLGAPGGVSVVDMHGAIYATYDNGVLTLVFSGVDLDPADLLANLLTVDGAGSLLDADKLDGLDSTAFALTVHAHAISDVTGLQAALNLKLNTAAYTAADVLAKLLTVDGAGSLLDADKLDGFSSSDFALVAHTHQISTITGLQAALDAKAPLVHVHSIADITNLQAILDTKAAALHTHIIADVTGLQSALDLKSPLAHGHTIAETTGLQAALDAKAPLVHVHAIAEVTGLDAALAGKAAVVHGHAIADIVALQPALDGKQPLDPQLSTIAAFDLSANALKVIRVNAAGTDFELAIDVGSGGGTSDWADIVNTPTTLAGYGITDAAPLVHTHTIAETTGLQAALDAKQPLDAQLTSLATLAYSGNALKVVRLNAAGTAFEFAVVAGGGGAVDWSEIINEPTTLAGYGITDAAPLVHTHTIANVSGLQTALDGKQPLDAQLTSLAALDYAGHPLQVIRVNASGTAFELATVTGGGGGTADWGDIINTPTTLAGYGITDAAPLVHTHDFDDIPGLQAALDGKALVVHTHLIADTTGLQAALDSKLPAASYTAADVLAKVKAADGAGSGLDADMLDGLNSNAFALIVHAHAITDVAGLQAALDAKANSVHGHAIGDITGLQAALDSKALAAHTHAMADITGLNLALAGKANTVHTHVINDVTGLQSALDTKLPASSYTAADVLAKMLTVDGPGSLLDADKLDGLDSTAFAPTVHTHSIANVTGLQVELDGKQPLDPELTSLAALVPAGNAAKTIQVNAAGTGFELGVPSAAVDSTDDVPEGDDNLYYTDDRAYDAIAFMWDHTYHIGATVQRAGDQMYLEVAQQNVVVKYQPAHGIARGMPLHLNGANWEKADADDGSKIADAVCWYAPNADTLQVAFSGLVYGDFAEWEAVTGEAGGLVPGDYYWLSTITGRMTRTQPTTGLIQCLGVALNTTELLVRIGEVVTAGEGGGGGGGGGAPDSNISDVVQAAHGLSVGMPIHLTGTAWQQADIDDATKTADGFVETVADSGSFVARFAGPLTATTAQWDARTGDTGGLTAGEYYWLSPTPGALTKTKPTTGYIQCLGVAMSATALLVRIGEVITGGGSGEAAAIIALDARLDELELFKIGQNSQSANYTLALTDSGKNIYHPVADTTARTWTIPANASVAFPIGSVVTFDNDFGAGAITIAITTDTLVLVGAAGSTGSRTLATGGMATAMKVAATRWRINGTLLT